VLAQKSRVCLSLEATTIAAGFFSTISVAKVGPEIMQAL